MTTRIVYKQPGKRQTPPFNPQARATSLATILARRATQGQRIVNCSTPITTGGRTIQLDDLRVRGVQVIDLTDTQGTEAQVTELLYSLILHMLTAEDVPHALLTRVQLGDIEVVEPARPAKGTRKTPPTKLEAKTVAKKAVQPIPYSMGKGQIISGVVAASSAIGAIYLGVAFHWAFAFIGLITIIAIFVNIGTTKFNHQNYQCAGLSELNERLLSSDQRQSIKNGLIRAGLGRGVATWKSYSTYGVDQNFARPKDRDSLVELAKANLPRDYDLVQVSMSRTSDRIVVSASSPKMVRITLFKLQVLVA